MLHKKHKAYGTQTGLNCFGASVQYSYEKTVEGYKHH